MRVVALGWIRSLLVLLIIYYRILRLYWLWLVPDHRNPLLIPDVTSYSFPAVEIADSAFTTLLMSYQHICGVEWVFSCATTFAA
jgi:hypothetical protein